MSYLKAYTLIENGFFIDLSKSLYDREAVMKALYSFHDKYVISYEVEEASIRVYFETSNLPESIEAEVAGIMKELNFQMIRLDTMRRTKSIRELLVARSLYATCIEPERSVPDTEEKSEISSWQEDQDRIFSSWAAE